MYYPYQNVCAGYPASRQVFQDLNARLASVAASYGVVVVDVFTTFGNHGPAPNPLVCDYTFFCDRNDVHPKKAGHDVIAGALRARLGVPY
jgi:lysophospholipase L1-like esterase